jgi:hypothetical protein
MRKPKPIVFKKSAKPMRQAAWTEDNHKVHVQIPKFKSRFGKGLCHLLRRPIYVSIRLDELGSFVWKKCDGATTLEAIFDDLQNNFDEENLEERLTLFVYQLLEQQLISL